MEGAALLMVDDHHVAPISGRQCLRAEAAGNRARVSVLLAARACLAGRELRGAAVLKRFSAAPPAGILGEESFPAIGDIGVTRLKRPAFLPTVTGCGAMTADEGEVR